MPSTAIVTCFFCNQTMRKDNLKRHCFTKHTILNTEICGGEVINKIRIVKTGGFCFNCQTIITSNYECLTHLRILSNKHKCKPTTTPSVSLPDVVPVRTESSSETECLDLLRKEVPELFNDGNNDDEDDNEKEDTNKTLLDRIKLLIKMNKYKDKKLNQKQTEHKVIIEQHEKQIDELNLTFNSLNVKIMRLEEQISSRDERIEYYEDKCSRLQFALAKKH